MRYKKARRNMQGSGLVEGVVGLTVITLLGVLLTFLILNVAYLMFYKQKIGYAATQTADFAASVLSWQNSYLQTPRFASRVALQQLNLIMRKAGLPAVRAQDFELIDDGKTATVSFKVNGLRLPGGPGYPAQVSLSETGAADVTLGEAPAILKIVPAGQPGRAIVVPVYPNKMQLRSLASLMPRLNLQIPGATLTQTNQPAN